MGRDYAKVQASARAKEKKESSSAFSALMIVVVATLCFAAGFWLGDMQSRKVTGKISQSDFNTLRSNLEKEKAAADLLQARIDSLEEQVEEWRGKAEADAHTKVGDLKFYGDLPKQAVTPAPMPDSKPAEARPMDKPLVVTAPGSHPNASRDKNAMVSFRIQVGSFKSHSDAEALHARMSKAGFNGVVRDINLGERGRWFRVYAGPYQGRELAEGVVRELQEKLKIKGLLIRDG